MYLLFALTVSTTLTALFGEHIPQNRRGEAFIGFFILLVLIAWAVDAWLVPAVAAGRSATWLPALFLIIFGAILVTSAILAARSSGPFVQAVVHHDNRLDAEAAAFDFLLWFAVLIFGIAVIRAIGI
ncbi:MAG: hypothetical protein ACM3MD_08125 [Betaproteobacteria bacterium]